MPDATFFNFSLVLVVLAAALDVLANMLLARSDGFRRRGPGLLALMLVGLAFIVFRWPCGSWIFP